MACVVQLLAMLFSCAPGVVVPGMGPRGPQSSKNMRLTSAAGERRYVFWLVVRPRCLTFEGPGGLCPATCNHFIQAPTAAGAKCSTILEPLVPVSSVQVDLKDRWRNLQKQGAV